MELHARSLRIGNLLNDNKSNSIIEVVGIKEDGIFGKGGNENGMDVILEPIPLTEERLVRLGFEKENNEGYEDDFKLIFRNNQCRITQNNSGHWSYWAEELWGFSVELHSVHQLQNLYYALTGEELKYD